MVIKFFWDKSYPYQDGTTAFAFNFRIYVPEKYNFAKYYTQIDLGTILEQFYIDVERLSLEKNTVLDSIINLENGIVYDR